MCHRSPLTPKGESALLSGSFGGRFVVFKERAKKRKEIKVLLIRERAAAPLQRNCRSWEAEYGKMSSSMGL